MTGSYGCTEAKELAVGDPVAYVKYYGFGSGAEVSLGRTVAKVTKTRVVVEFTVNRGKGPETYADRWVINNHGELRAREGSYGSYHEPKIYKADSDEVAKAQASNDKLKVRNAVKHAAQNLVATNRFSDEDVAALEEALAAFKASKAGDDE